MAAAIQQACKVLSLKGKVALITGAGSGIGAGTSILFAKLGAKLALNERNVEKLKETAQQCDGAQKEKAFLVPGDVTDEAAARKMIQDTIAHYGQLDVLVNNAGIAANGSIEDTNLEQYDKIMNTNIRAVYHLTHLAVPHLVKSKGCIVNISSLAGLRSLPGVLAYSLSKSALDQFTRCVALELASKQVRVNAVNPGVIITDIFKGISEEDLAQFLERSKKTHPLGRVGKSDEVAQTVAFLASEAASFITGVTLSVDAGCHVNCTI